MNPDRPGVSLLGTLALHAGHLLVCYQRYISPPGRVYGHPHMFIHCEQCKILIWDQQIGEDQP